MAEQKAFYEMEKAPKKRYAVVAIEIKSTEICQQTEQVFDRSGKQVGTLTCDCDWLDILCCDYCGLPTCDNHIQEHMNSEKQRVWIACENCSNLPADIRRQVREFRQELNR